MVIVKLFVIDYWRQGKCLLNIYKSKVCAVQNTSRLFMEPTNTILDKGKLQLASSSLLVRTLTPAQEHCLQCHIAAKVGRGNNSRIAKQELNYPHLLGHHFC